MRSVRVDPKARRAYVGAGAVWGDVDHETQAHALATTGGLVSTTGVAGFTLGGGIGWLMRKHGLACDNLVGADVVTADGCLVHASETENAELLLGLARRRRQLRHRHPVRARAAPGRTDLYAGLIFFSAEHDAELMRLFREWAPDAPDEITAALNLTTAPAAARRARGVARQEGDRADSRLGRPDRRGRGHFRSFREAAEPVADLLGPMPYTAMQTLIDPLWPKGIHAYFKATNLARLDDTLIEQLCRRHEAAPGPQCEIHVHQMGGAVASVGDDDTAFSERSMPYVLNAVTGWHDPEAAAAHTAVGALGHRCRRRSVHGTGLRQLPRRLRGGADRLRGRRPTPAWWRSSASTTRPTCSGSTRTFHPPPERRDPALESVDPYTSGASQASDSPAPPRFGLRATRNSKSEHGLSKR